MASQDSQTIFHWHNNDFDDSNFKIRGSTLFFVIVLFCALLLLTLLYLYARWVCRFRPPPPTSSAAHFTHSPPPRQGLDPNTISKLPIVLHRASTNTREAAECSICLGIFEDGEKVKVLPICQHCFHSECVDKWLTTHSSCPLCRTSLQVDSLV